MCVLSTEGGAEAEAEAGAEAGAEAEAEAGAGAGADYEEEAFEEEAHEKGRPAEDEEQSRSYRPTVQLPPTTSTPTRARGARGRGTKLPLHTPGQLEMGPPGHGDFGYNASELQEPPQTYSYPYP